MKGGVSLRIGDYVVSFVKTYPETYYVYSGDKQVGHIELRKNHLIVEYPEYGGACLLSAIVDLHNGEWLDKDRKEWLECSVKVIEDAVKR